MKIRVRERSVDEVLAIPPEPHRTPVKQNPFLRVLVRTLSSGELKQVGFHYTSEGMERLASGEPALYLMNHSSFIDLKIASHLIDRPYHIVCTRDGFVGKDGLLRALGCIPARKFITDVPLVSDMTHITRKLRESVLLFPEASYSFDGTATPLPASLGKCVRLLKVPVIMIRTYGAFQRDPLYNGLRLRQVPVSAKMTYLLSPEEAAKMKPEEINEILREQFAFDHFAWQKEEGIRISEDFRATGLERALFRCPVCEKERKMHGEGIRLTCSACGSEWELTETGELSGPGEHLHIPDWYRYERACIRRELEDGTYREEVPVDILILADTKAVYRVGEGVLTHDRDGFTLTGCDGRLSYTQAPAASYSLYADYFWYEIGDMVCIGDLDRQYYCFPKDPSYPVARMRLAAEELYRITTGAQS